ncbi:hypothetical protein [Paraburkholderia diazotrophica]|uniref:hypothetical protein n=1 Tax=Paraburkholderia diazotrophica TaxID=667676 RepID=UPI00317E2B80
MFAESRFILRDDMRCSRAGRSPSYLMRGLVAIGFIAIGRILGPGAIGSVSVAQLAVAMAESTQASVIQVIVLLACVLPATTTAASLALRGPRARTGLCGDGDGVSDGKGCFDADSPSRA